MRFADAHNQQWFVFGVNLDSDRDVLAGEVRERVVLECRVRLVLIGNRFIRQLLETG